MSTLVELDALQPEHLSLTVVCPMFNEEAKIAEVLERLCSVLERLQTRHVELVVVNDGSTDDSLARAQAALEGKDWATLVTYRQNRGRGYAIRQGLNRAKGELVVVTESDLAYGEDIVQRLVDELVRRQADVVVASPHAPGGELVNVPFVRKLYTVLGNRVLRVLMPVRLTTYTGMTRGYRREVVEDMDLQSDGKELHLELLVKLAAQGCRIVEIPARLAWAPGRKTRKSTFQARRYIFSHLAFGVGESPLLVLALTSLAMIGVGGVCGLYLLYLSASGTPVAGRPLIDFSMLSIVVGVVMLMFGWLSHQNKRLERELIRVQGRLAQHREHEQPGESPSRPSPGRDSSGGKAQ